MEFPQHAVSASESWSRVSKSWRARERRRVRSSESLLKKKIHAQSRDPSHPRSRTVHPRKVLKYCRNKGRAVLRASSRAAVSRRRAVRVAVRVCDAFVSSSRSSEHLDASQASLTVAGEEDPSQESQESSRPSSSPAPPALRGPSVGAASAKRHGARSRLAASAVRVRQVASNVSRSARNRPAARRRLRSLS